MAFMIQVISSLWIGSEWKYSINDVECKHNETFSLLEKLEENCSLIPKSLSPCDMVTLETTLNLMIIILARRFTPISIDVKEHSTLFINYLSLLADIYDFAGYSNNELITNIYGVHLVWSLQMISSVQLSFVLTSNKTIIKNNKQKNKLELLLDFIFGTETWALLDILITQELPCSIASNSIFILIFLLYLIFHIFIYGPAT